MPLSSGTRLGPYEILSAIGAGGMGEVYRARDTKLNRDVALKILPAGFAADPDRLARFKREALVLATAVAAGATMIVTGDDDLLVLGNYSRIEIVPPRCFLERLDADS